MVKREGSAISNRGQEVNIQHVAMKETIAESPDGTDLDPMFCKK